MKENSTTTAVLVPLETIHGTFEAALTERGVAHLAFPNQHGAGVRWLGRHGFAVTRQASDPRASSVAGELNAYLRGEVTAFDAPIDLVGTSFQLSVWGQLRAIPYGEVRSYLDVARAIGRPDAVRAVGAANGANPVPIIVPCHRVIGSSGALTGFGGGLDWKRRLLATENSARWGAVELPLPV